MRVVDAAAGAVAALAVAWLVYRIERTATRRRDIVSARALLGGLWRGMVDGQAGVPGWGELYATSNHTSNLTSKVTEDAAATSSTPEELLLRTCAQLLVVPTAPLGALISSPHAGDLISETTIYFANIGLWHLEVFNQLVVQRSQLLTQYQVRISEKKLGERRRSLIARTLGSQAAALQRRSVVGSSTDGEWYRELKASVESDIARLDAALAKRWYPAGERRLALGDATAMIAVLAVAGILLATNIGGGTRAPNFPPLPTVTDPYH